MIFSPAKPGDLDAVWRVYEDAVPHQNRQGIDHWDANYPTKAIIADDIAERRCFIVRENGVTAAVLRLDSEQDPAYLDIEWRYGEPYVCVHRLCVHPGFQGNGLAKRIMLDVIALYKSEGYAAIRLDTYMPNRIAMRLYEGLGFERRGTVHFDGRGDRDFMCFEFDLAFGKPQVNEAK
ncbi:MAG: GNAT family N-acetyltransferase [Clostridiales bacterium]|jgi:ribosomal protein S18 acetylase RimI-like enzyme|nr:GNAT family N-acetyltransferase [Clostridiales bacterium]